MMAERFGPVGSERYREYLKDIHASGGHLLSLINDLLDLSKIEAGRLELTFASVSLNDLTQQCVAIMQPQANRDRIIIRTSLPPSLPQVVADARSVRQIVLNLLSNSIKFTDAGGQVIVSTALNDNGDVALRVRDTGAGMSEKDLATALEPFRQLVTPVSGVSGGTGLGLPLTKATKLGCCFECSWHTQHGWQWFSQTFRHSLTSSSPLRRRGSLEALSGICGRRTPNQPEIG
jgi:signal transduction histidine kinase